MKTKKQLLASLDFLAERRERQDGRLSLGDAFELYDTMMALTSMRVAELEGQLRGLEERIRELERK